MAKGSNVFYKLPIEEMRGKLATKQDGIMYAGQTEGENTLSIGSGFHSAKNFEKYIVLTKTRGQNRFYVKSRTTVANTVGTVNTRAILALAMPLVDAMYEHRDDSVQMDGLKVAYEYYQKGETLREYLTRIVVDAIRKSATTITYQSKPNAQGLIETVTLMGNPYAAYNTEAQPVLSMLRVFGSTADEAKIIQEYLKYRALQMSVSRINIRLHDTVNGGTYTFALLAITNVTTFAQLAGTTQATAFRITSAEGAITGITLFPFNKKNYSVSGQPFLDAAKSQPLTPTAIVSEITDLYIDTNLS